MNTPDPIIRLNAGPFRLAVALLTASLGMGCDSDTPASPAERDSDPDTRANIPMVEREALAALHNNTDGNNWNLDVGWLVGSDPCSWIGVTCEEGHVTELNLDQNDLSGPIPAELGNLAALSVLNLGDNQLSGPIPAELGNLPALTFLGLSNNDLTGSIPAELGNSVALDELRIDSNQLSGPIPADLGGLTALRVLNLGDNQLSGPIPAALGNLTGLVSFRLDINELSGLIPVKSRVVCKSERKLLDASVRLPWRPPWARGVRGPGNGARSRPQ